MNTKKVENGAEVIAKSLHGYGVSHVFYIEAMLRFASLEMEKLGIQRIITHSEKAAAYMADGYARVSGRPGVCMAQSVGAANLAAGLQDARLGCSPVIAITGKKDSFFQNRNAYQELVHQPMYSAVTKMHAEVVAADQIPHLFRLAFRTAVTGKPGPVHLDMPNHMGRTVELDETSNLAVVDDDFRIYPPFRPVADISRIEAAAAVLEKSMRPVIVVGGGARVSGAGDAIIALARKQEIPVVTTPDGKGEIDEWDPLWGGIVGNYSTVCANKIVNRADAVIYIGSQVSDQVTCDWTIPKPGTVVIQIDIEPAELGKNYPDTLGIAGDARTVVEQLSASVSVRNRNTWLMEAAGYVAEWAAEHKPTLTSSSVPIHTERLCLEIERILPDDAVLVADTGYSAIWAATLIRMKPGQTFIRAAGSLGWAYPASLGAKCGAPNRPVVCFTGDGAFYYHLAEMETAVRYGIKTVTIVNNNQAFSQGVDEVKRVHREAGSKSNPEDMYRFSPVNLARIAEEFGLTAFRVKNPDDLESTLKKALACSGPSVVEVLTDIDSRAATAWKPEKTNA